MTDENTNVQETPQIQEVTLTLDINKVNTILASLDEMPHKYARVVIDTILQQIQGQIPTP